MTVERVHAGDRIVLRMAGRMDADNCGVFEQSCQACISEGATHLVIDLDQLSYVSSMGLRSFLAIGKILREKGGDLRLCRLKGLVKQVSEITRLTISIRRRR